MRVYEYIKLMCVMKVTGKKLCNKSGIIDRSSLVKDLSPSIAVGTRKMVIYA